MKCSWVSQIIPTLCLIESLVACLVMGILFARVIYITITQTFEEMRIPPYTYALIISQGVAVHLTYFCVTKDWSLLKATEKKRDVGSAIKLCKIWLILNMVTFTWKLLVVSAVTYIYCLHSQMSQLSFSFPKYSLYSDVFSVIIFLLFPGPFVMFIYFERQTTHHMGQSNLWRLRILVWMFIIVLLRGCSLIFVIRYNQKLKMMNAQTTPPRLKPKKGSRSSRKRTKKYYSSYSGNKKIKGK